MTELGPLWPGWAASHPIFVHFPVAWMLASLVCTASALVAARKGRSTLLRVAFALAVAATLAALVALRSGEAAGATAVLPPGGDLLLARHQQLARLTVAWAMAFLCLLGKTWHLLRDSAEPMTTVRRERFWLALCLALAVIAVGCCALTAHVGGRLVHQLGVRAWATPAASDATPR